MAWFIAVILLPCVDAYDPLHVEGPKPATRDLVASDGKRAREIPMLVYLPADSAAASVILFSHGLGGSRNGGAYLGEHWAKRGYVSVFLQHPGSDDGVWRGKPLAQVMPAMREAASAENLGHRARDVSAVLDQLEKWNTLESHPLRGRLNLKSVGMCGHSFGATTSQAVGGQSTPLGRSLVERRVTAAVMMSPSTPVPGGDSRRFFGDVTIPWLLMTGTRDHSLIRDIDPKARLEVFPALPLGGKYELVLDKAVHSAFTDRQLPGERGQRNPNHHKAILALTTAFWDAYLRHDQAARRWLDGDGVRSVLEKNDRWQRK
jgi:predicted dienelactone hydrolase